MLVPDGLSGAAPLQQVSVLKNHKGTLRGFHVAEFPGHNKLVSCLQGRVMDVLIDVRPHSPTFRSVAKVELNGERPEAVVCPAGVAHAFMSLTEGALVTVGVDAAFDAVAERTFDALDPELGVDWPVTSAPPIRSERDASAPTLAAILGDGFSFEAPKQV